jgi:hypothetical protein
MDQKRRLLAERMISIPIKHINVLVRELVATMRQKGVKEPPNGFTSEDLKKFFLKESIFPPETFYERNFFSAEKPVLTVTYMWPATPIEELARLLEQRYDKECTAYIDILLNDQRLDRIDFSLANARIRLKRAKQFFVS